MNEEKREYPVSDDIAEYFISYEAALELRDKALNMPFGYRKALKASKDIVKNQRIFWKKVRQVYPELKDKSLDYNRVKQTISVQESL